VPPNNHLRLLVHFDDEQGQGLVTLVLAPTKKYSPQFFSVDGVIGLLQVNEGCIVPSLLALPRMNLGEQPGYVGGGGGALLEAGLVDPSLQEVRGQCGHLRHDGLLEDLCQVRPHHNWSDVFKFSLVHPLVL